MSSSRYNVLLWRSTTQQRPLRKPPPLRPRKLSKPLSVRPWKLKLKPPKQQNGLNSAQSRQQRDYQPP